MLKEILQSKPEIIDSFNDRIIKQHSDDTFMLVLIPDNLKGSLISFVPIHVRSHAEVYPKKF